VEDVAWRMYFTVLPLPSSVTISGSSFEAAPYLLQRKTGSSLFGARVKRRGRRFNLGSHGPAPDSQNWKSTGIAWQWGLDSYIEEENESPRLE
jgi:hypothetical protein